MRIAFTICSNNYLAQAKVLVDSFLKFNPGYSFYIGLVDELSDQIDYRYLFSASEVIVLNEFIIPNFNEMIGKFNIVELNTAVKPFFFQYLINKYQPKHIHYFDPDIMIFHKMDHLETLLDQHSIILTPHFFNPIPIDGKQPFENMALNYGLYNLGYLGLNGNSPIVTKFLEWWGERTFKYGHSKTAEGFFVDQLWINLVPLFYKEVAIVEKLGYNMAPWNLHERKIRAIGQDGSVTLSNGEPLVFYHFSSYDFKQPQQLSKYYDRYTFENTPELKPLYDQYQKALLENQITKLVSIPCALKIITYQPRFKHKVAAWIMPWLKSIWDKL